MLHSTLGGFNDIFCDTFQYFLAFNNEYFTVCKQTVTNGTTFCVLYLQETNLQLLLFPEMLVVFNWFSTLYKQK